MGLDAKIWASRLEYELQGGWTEKKEEKEEEEEKFSLCVKA